MLLYSMILKVFSNQNSSMSLGTNVSLVFTITMRAAGPTHLEVVGGCSVVIRSSVVSPVGGQHVLSVVVQCLPDADPSNFTPEEQPLLMGFLSTIFVKR